MALSLKDRLAKAASGENTLELDPMANTEGRYTFIRVDDIVPDPNQPRKDLGDIDELANSIKSHGLIEPIVVEPHGNRTFQIIAGERRYHACKQAGLHQVPAIVRTLEEQERLEIQLIENLHRKNLNVFEEAATYTRLMDEFNLTQKALAERIGKTQPAINQTLRILDLPEQIYHEYQNDFPANKSVLLEIARMESADEQLRLWEMLKSGNLTVQEARHQTRKTRRPRNGANGANDHGHTIKFKTSEVQITIKFKRNVQDPDEQLRLIQEALEAWSD